MIASAVSEIQSYFSNSENLYDQTSSRPHLNLIKMKIQKLVENTNVSLAISNDKALKKNSLDKKSIRQVDKVKCETQLNEETSVKVRSKKRDSIFLSDTLSGVAAWRSSPSLSYFHQGTFIDLEKIEKDLN